MLNQVDSVKHPNLEKIYPAIFDRRLYTRFMVFSILSIGFGLVIPAITFFYLLNVSALLIHVLWVSIFVLFSALLTKNVIVEFHAIHHWLAFLFLISSVLAFSYSFIIKYGTDVIGLSQFALIYGIALLTIYFSILYIAVAGQRRSLRESIGLNTEFFAKKEKIWKSQLEDFPNSEKITRELRNGKFVIDLFDNGSFSLAVLWSCNVMEEIINAATSEIIQRSPLKKVDFRTDKGMPNRIPVQLKNLTYVHKKIDCRADEKIEIDVLWDKVRNSIAHRNHRATFEETFGSLVILVSFIEEFPTALIAYGKAHPELTI